ncbi:MAG: hypothetical protein WBQ21_11700 [Solirubrobacteraceae bacterium]
MAEETPQREADIIGWFPEEPEQAAAALSFLRNNGTVERISGENDADVTARWTASPDATKAMEAKASAEAAQKADQ